jgi:hypothetical protein
LYAADNNKRKAIYDVGSTETSIEGQLWSILFPECSEQNTHNVYYKCEIATLKHGEGIPVDNAKN